MLWNRVLVLAPALLALAFPVAADAQNPWLERRVLHMAHQGGENEAPSNTFFAYEKAIANGADMLEMDVNITADRHLVVMHDTTVDGRTNGTGRVNELTLAQIKRLDPADNWPEYRGIALGTKAPPAGFTRADFQIPTLREVLTRYPHMLINLEIKGEAPDTGPDAVGFLQQVLKRNPTVLDCATEMARVLQQFNRVGDTIVVSFSDLAMTRFKSLAPAIHTAGGLVTTAAFYASSLGPLGGLGLLDHKAVQPPTFFQGIEVPTKDFVDAAHANGRAVHVWMSGAPDDATTYARLVANGVDGIMTDHPSRLEAFLQANGLAY